jgi:phosphate-selective porin OprO/OprP
MKWISTASLVLAAGFALTASQTLAQQVGTAQASDDTAARLEQQERQIQQLQAQISGMQQGVSATSVSFAPTGGTAADPAPAASEGYVVGSDMSIKARFWNGAGVMFETPNKDFTMHLGGWAQWDNVSWSQNALNNSATAGNIGPLEDGDYWRRIRLVMEGNFWETYEYRWNFAFENIEASSVGLDEFWVGDNKIPVIGTVRAGHIKSPIGLEGDMTSSSRTMTFMERSSYSEAIELNQNFVTGIWFGNTAYDDRLFWSAAAFRPDTYSNGDFFGTGQWGAQARITGLPLYEDEGRHLLHLGVSGGWRNGINVANGVGTPTYVSIGARPELRDDDPAGSPANISGGTAQYLGEANSNKMVSTGNIYCNQEFLLGTELLYIRGPLSLQAEYGWNMLNDAYMGSTGTGTALKAAGPAADYVFNGGYVQLSYMLTGENRAYDKKSGGLSRYYLGSQGPYENAFLVRDEEGGICSGHGAWEVACRYSYIDLNSGFGPIGSSSAGGTHIQGGCMDGVSLALNWYLNTNVSLMTDWVYDYRYDMPINGVNGATSTKAVGSTNGLGTELQLSF